MPSLSFEATVPGPPSMLGQSVLLSFSLPLSLRRGARLVVAAQQPLAAYIYPSPGGLAGNV